MQKWHSEVRQHIKREFTMYPRKLLREYNHTKSDGRTMVVREYDHGDTIHVIEDDNEQIFIGIAELSDMDQYNRKTGRNVARGRAEEAMALEHGMLVDTHGKYASKHTRDIKVHTKGGKEIEGKTIMREPRNGISLAPSTFKLRMQLDTMHPHDLKDDA